MRLLIAILLLIGLVGDASATQTEGAIISGGTILGVAVEKVTTYKITEDGDQKITEDGDNKITEDN